MKQRGRAVPPGAHAMMVGIRDEAPGKTRVSLELSSGEVLLFDPDEARRTASALYRAAEVVEGERFLHSFLAKIALGSGEVADGAEATELADSILGEFRRQRIAGINGKHADSA